MSTILEDFLRDIEGPSTKPPMTKWARDLIESLTEDGHTPVAIRYAMEDGEYLKTMRISKETAEQVHDWAVSNA